MPTGYTAAVQDGSITELPEFAMQCARAFGALVTMRDEPSDAQIPDEFKPSDYHQKALDAAKAELATLNAMTPIECDIAAEVSFSEQYASSEKRQAKRLEQRARYTDMRTKAEAWAPPTPDHAQLREFMLDQLDSSIKLDCGDYEEARPVLQTGSEWHFMRTAQVLRDIEYHDKEHASEVTRAKTRTNWVRALRASLNIIN